jgi:1-acyl-sn-glycerol-3-phosphate acyltransferase
MLIILSRFILKLMGWRITSVIPHGTKKCVIAVAPHTSYWDFVIGRLAYWVMGIKASFLIKKEAFTFPFGALLRHMGGIPVDRGRSSKMVDDVVDRFNRSESLFIVITPEGTRKPVKQWKKGFYYIAHKANVPIALGYLDYAKKEGGVGKVIMPDGDLEKQLKEIRDFYKDMTPKHRERYYKGE